MNRDKPFYKLENTGIFINRSRDRFDLVMELEKIRYKMKGIDFYRVMQDITDTIPLYEITAGLDTPIASLKETGLAFEIGHTGKALYLHYKGETYSVSVASVERVLEGDIAGHSLSRIPKQ